MKAENTLLFVIIDDDPTTHLIARLHFRAINPSTELIHFKHPAEALDALKELLTGNSRKPDAIFLDLYMPEMTGFDLLEAVRDHVQSNAPALQFYMVSSTIEEPDVQKAREHDMITEFLEKPLDIEWLRRNYPARNPTAC